MSNNFTIRIRKVSKPWPFSWGPFGRSVQWWSTTADSANLEIHQDGDHGKPIEICCYAGKKDLTTTISFVGSPHLKRRTTP